jgi:hypothetical protein
MSVKILNNVPTSGELEEIHFGEHFTHRLWVEFETNDYENWVGCFPMEHMNGFKTVLVNQTNKVGFIVAGGIGYLIDIKEKKLILKTDEHPLIESVILTQDPDYFIAGTFYSIYVIDNEKMVRQISPDFIIDGIYFKKQKNGKAIGELATAENQYDFNIAFEFDLKTFELTFNQKVTRKKIGLFENVSVEDKDSGPKQGLLKRMINKMKK